MDSITYARNVARTMNTPLNEEQQVLNYALGLSNEMLECVYEHQRSPEKLFDELGDVSWYCMASACVHFNPEVFRLDNEAYPALRLPRPMRTFQDLARAVSNYSEMVKKTKFHGRDYDLTKTIALLREVWCALRDVCPQETGRSHQDVLTHNVAKLTYLWPNGFVQGGPTARKENLKDILREHFDPGPGTQTGMAAAAHRGRESSRELDEYNKRLTGDGS